MDTWRILAWGLVASMLGVIVFVRAGQNGGVNGGAQASSIINATTSGIGEIIRSAEGM